MSSITVGVLHFHGNGDLRFLEIINLVSGIIISAVFIYGAIDLAKRNIKMIILQENPDEVAIKLSEGASSLIVDRGYLRI